MSVEVRTPVHAGLPETISYSQFSTYLECGERYYLERVKKVVQNPAWWFLGGSAAHETTEVWDEWWESNELGEDDEPDLVAVFAEKLAVQVAEADTREPDRTKWFGGKSNEDFWLENGPIWVQNWADWRQSSGWRMWMMGDIPAVELGLVQPWSNGLVSRGFIDRMMYDPDDFLTVVDLKFGGTTPDDASQLGLYAVGMEQTFGIKPQFGAFFMARKAKMLPQEPLVKYTEPYFDHKFTIFDQARHAGIFLANPGSHCHRCSVKGFCPEWTVTE